MCLEELESCIQDVQIWMRTNLLRLNDDKTEFLIIGTPQQLAKVRTTSIKIGTDQIQCSESACNLGYFYDSTMKGCTHINKLSSMLYITIKRISRIRYTIDLDTTKTLVQALVTMKLDYCNSLMLGTPGYNISKLQHIQNAAARVVYGKRFVLHITPYLKELHWLKVRERITYKIACLMYKCVNGTAPKYLQELVLKTHNTALRSSSQLKLPISKSNLSFIHKSSFSSMGPRTCNSLSQHLRCAENLDTFKGLLKTHLFKCSYN